MWEALFDFHIRTACLQPELLRRPVVERTVRTLAIVLMPPAGQGAAYVLQCSEPTCMQALVAQLSVKTPVPAGRVSRGQVTVQIANLAIFDYHRL